MGTEIDQMKEFKDRVLDKLKVDIGSLMPDEALSELVQQAVKETFFEDKVIKNNYGQVTSTEKSWFVKEILSLLEPKLKEAADKFVNDNASKTKQAIKDYLTEERLQVTTAIIIASMARNNATQEIQVIQQELRNKGIISW